MLYADWSELDHMLVIRSRSQCQFCQEEVRVILHRKVRVLLQKKKKKDNIYCISKSCRYYCIYYCHELRMYFLTETMQTGDCDHVAKQVPQVSLRLMKWNLGNESNTLALGGSYIAWREKIPFLMEVPTDSASGKFQKQFAYQYLPTSLSPLLACTSDPLQWPHGSHTQMSCTTFLLNEFHSPKYFSPATIFSI